MKLDPVLIIIILLFGVPAIITLIVWRLADRKTKGLDVFVLETQNPTDRFIVADETFATNIEDAIRFPFRYGTEPDALDQANLFAKTHGFRIVNMEEAEKVVGSY